MRRVELVRTSGLIHREKDGIEYIDMEVPGDDFTIAPGGLSWPNPAMPAVYVIWQRYYDED